MPPALLRASELRGRYIQFAKTSEEASRIVQDSLFGLENSIKVQRKQLDALLDDALLVAKRDAEADLRLRVGRNRAFAAEIGDPWQKIEQALAVEATRRLPYEYIEGGTGLQQPAWRATRARWFARRPSARSRTPSGCASTRTASCRAWSSSSARPCRSIPSSSG